LKIYTKINSYPAHRRRKMNHVCGGDVDAAVSSLWRKQRQWGGLTAAASLITTFTLLQKNISD
jgi:hypothetical protein